MRDNDTHTDDQYAWHMRAIADTLSRWRTGEITTQAKRRAIADENQRYYADQIEPWMARTGRRYELPAVLAETWGVDEEVMIVALNQRREYGAEAYEQVLASARLIRKTPAEVLAEAEAWRQSHLERT